MCDNIEFRPENRYRSTMKLSRFNLTFQNGKMNPKKFKIRQDITHYIYNLSIN